MDLHGYSHAQSATEVSFPPPRPRCKVGCGGLSGTLGATILGATLHRGRGGTTGLHRPGTGAVVDNFGSRFWQVAFRGNVGLYFMRGASTPNHHGTAVAAHIPGHHASGIRQPSHGGEVRQHHCGKTLLSRSEGMRGLPLLLGLMFYWWNWWLGRG